jgi:hypothetical protein
MDLSDALIALQMARLCQGQNQTGKRKPPSFGTPDQTNKERNEHD